MELNITCRFMSIEEIKVQDGMLYKCTFFIEGRATDLYLSEKNPAVREFMEMGFGETVTITIVFADHPKMAGAYKMKFKALVG